MKSTELSIIILSYNTKDILRACLRSIKNSQGDIEYETVVVDNNSSDGSPKMIKTEFPWVKLVESKRNLGFAGGNNLGLKYVRGRFVLFLNSDVELKPNALWDSLELIRKDQEIGAVTPKILLFSGGIDPDCHRGFPAPFASLTYFLGLAKLFPKSRLFDRYHKFYLDLTKNHEIDAGCGAFMLVRKKALDQVGNMDESYFFYGEDLDLYYRMKEAGWKVMFLAKPLAYHHKGASSGLRGESKKISTASRETKLATAKASIGAMEIFYKKFYKDKYPALVTWIVLSGIRAKGAFRIARFWLFG